MRKTVLLFVLAVFLNTGLFAQAYNNGTKSFANNPQNQQNAEKQESLLIRYSRLGLVNELRRLLSHEFSERRFAPSGPFYYFIMRDTDSHGNNALHVAKTDEVFSLLNNSAHALQKELLSQKNNAGETPWMALISYDRGRIFVKHFPGSALAREMRKVKKDLNSTGLNRMVAEIKRDALIKECSAGGQTMWQRADALWRMAPEGSRDKEVLYTIRHMIGAAAPFLVR